MRLFFPGMMALGALALAGCAGQAAQERLSAAYEVQAVAGQTEPAPPLPASCTAEIGVARLKAGEAFVVTQERWLILAANRNALARACPADWKTYWAQRQGSGND